MISKMPIHEIELFSETLPMPERTQAAAIRELAAVQAEHERLIQALTDAIARIEQAQEHFTKLF
ncbi:hypothetical protein ACTOV4_02770 [Brucella sp. C7-11G]